MKMKFWKRQCAPSAAIPVGYPAEDLAVKASVKTRMAMALGASFLMATMNVLLAVPVSLESAHDYVRTIAGTNASNVVLYSPTEAVKIIDTVFKPNREDVSDWPDWKFERMKHLVADGFAALIGYDDIGHEAGNWEKTFATREYRLVHRYHGRDERSGRRNGGSRMRRGSHFVRYVIRGG